ncbi:Major facilitator superfamily domain-containing 6 [Brachionus plicatilis]|uniref:Major facilitator superfamily domain-containing 6 n=1 Tax=Brachionus plicatilis TaxID=10195 RepID=A0A3M7Q275_BRAPC|nr:Major facilitator superfamily domain-containing 6 [Brachionus plicatilis]
MCSKKEVVEEPDETSSEAVTPSNFDSIGDETFEDTSFEIDQIAYVDLKIISEIKDFILSGNCSKLTVSDDVSSGSSTTSFFEHNFQDLTFYIDATRAGTMAQNLTHYQEQTNTGQYDDSDLYEYDAEPKGIAGQMKNFLGSVQLKTSNDDNHSTHQYRRDFIDSLCSQINQTLLIPKAFYFFFFAAFGSLFPLMAIYFKQMAMSPVQVGILFGFKPFIEFLSVPFWASFSERWKKGKLILLGSLVCWIVFTLAIGFVKPPVHSCLMHNESHIFLEKSKTAFINGPAANKIIKGGQNVVYKRSLHQLYQNMEPNSELSYDKSKFRYINITKVIKIRKTRTSQSTTFQTPTTTTTTTTKQTTVSTTATTTLSQVIETKKNSQIAEKSSGLVTKVHTQSKENLKKVQKTHYFDPEPLDSSKKRSKIIYMNDSSMRLVKPSLETSIVYHKSDVNKVFLVFLIFILAGEFFSAPAITLVDTCTLQYLGASRSDLYGRQRMFGSLGWALAMFSVGLLLDNSKAFTDHPCGKAGPDERNYTVCFAIYSVLMGCALIIATQFKFNYEEEEIPLKSMAHSIQKKVNKMRGDQFGRKKFVNESDDDDDDDEQGEDHVPQPQPIDLSQNSKMAKLFEACKTWKLLAFLFVVWFMGIGVGLAFTFLFWHLQDMGGTPSLYGIASVINHMSELMAYFFVHQIVRKYGHVKVFYAGLLGNAARFIYVSILTEPYWILPFELIQGVTHALVWATATSYFAQSVPEDLRSSAQGILQAIHFGLGRGCGALIGGIFVTSFGSKATFAAYGILCLVTMFAYISINNYLLNTVARQNLAYNQNELVNEENFDSPNTIYNPNFDPSQVAEMNSSVNPNLFDSNYYYQPSSQNGNHQNSTNSSQLQFNSTSNDKSEKTYAKMAEMNGSISEELKSRVRSSTAKTKGYEKFDNTSFNFIDLEMNEENSESIQQDSDYQLDAKNYSKLEKVKSKRSFLKIKNKSRWIVPPNSEYLSNVDSSISNSVPSISAMATVAN